MALFNHTEHLKKMSHFARCDSGVICLLSMGSALVAWVFFIHIGSDIDFSYFIHIGSDIDFSYQFKLSTPASY